MGFDRQTMLASPTGASLNIFCMAAKIAPRGVVHICHGLAEHAARYARFAEALARRGFHAYAHDHRGHGSTIAPDAPLGRFAGKDGADRVLDDIDCVHAHIALEHRRLPLILFGHSMGATVALNSVLRRSSHLAGAAIWNTNVSPGIMGRVAQAILTWEKFRLGSDLPSRLLPRLTFQDWGEKVPGHRTPFDWLSRDPAEVDKYIADPLCGWDASVSMWRDIFGMIFTTTDDRNFARVRRDLPVNLVGGGADPSTVGGQAVEELAERMRRLGFSNLVSRIYPETRHESLNEINRDEITADFTTWAEDVVAGRRAMAGMPGGDRAVEGL